LEIYFLKFGEMAILQPIFNKEHSFINWSIEVRKRANAFQDDIFLRINAVCVILNSRKIPAEPL
jgi:hypothetical protein